jgi:CheY-like chemotaxis protein
LGHKTIVAKDGLEAVELFMENQMQIQLMVTDLSMPLMDGVATAKQVRQLNSSLPIIFSTGCDLGDAMLKGTEDIKDVKVLFKPYQAKALKDVIDQLMNTQLSWEI